MKTKYAILFTSCMLAMHANAAPSIATEYANASATADTPVIGAVNHASGNTGDDFAKYNLTSINQLGDIHFTPPHTNYFEQNGVLVAHTNLSAIPIVDISIIFNTGAAFDDTIKADGAGIANMTAQMLTQGTKNLSEDEFITKQEILAVDLNAAADHDNFTVSLRSLNDDKTLDGAVALLTDALANPAFDKQALGRNKANLITAINQNLSEPTYVASLQYFSTLYGNHPYAKPVTGTKDSIKALTKQDVEAFYSKYLVAQNAKIVITGDIDHKKAMQIADAITKALPQGQKAPMITKSAYAPKSAHIHVPHQSKQVAVMIGNVVDAQKTDATTVQRLSDFNLGNDVLAGFDFTARLMDVIREKNGYTYGIYGILDQGRSAGSYTIDFTSGSDVVAPAINKTLEVVDDALQNGITSDELAAAKKSAKGSFPARFVNNARTHRAISQLISTGYDKDHLQNTLARIDNATLESVNTELKQWIKPHEFIIVTAGAEKPEINGATTAAK